MLSFSHHQYAGSPLVETVLCGQNTQHGTHYWVVVGNGNTVQFMCPGRHISAEVKDFFIVLCLKEDGLLSLDGVARDRRAFSDDYLASGWARGEQPFILHITDNPRGLVGGQLTKLIPQVSFSEVRVGGGYVPFHTLGVGDLDTDSKKEES